MLRFLQKLKIFVLLTNLHDAFFCHFKKRLQREMLSSLFTNYTIFNNY